MMMIKELLKDWRNAIISWSSLLIKFSPLLSRGGSMVLTKKLMITPHTLYLTFSRARMEEEEEEVKLKVKE